MAIHLTNYRIYKENKDLYWWLFDLWENKDHNVIRIHESHIFVLRKVHFICLKLSTIPHGLID